MLDIFPKSDKRASESQDVTNKYSKFVSGNERYGQAQKTKNALQIIDKKRRCFFTRITPLFLYIYMSGPCE